MSAKKYETVIIGAGISGLACAEHLNKNGEDFLIISKDIGGRILTSEDGNVNYGAFFVCSDYHNVLKYVTLKSRIRLRDFCFHEKNYNYALFEPKILLYASQFLKIKKILNKFRKKLRILRKNSAFISQKQAIENDSFLYEIYMQKAPNFINNYNLKTGTDVYLSKALYSTTFSTIHEMNAFSFVQFLIPLITPIYTFKFEKNRMIQPFYDKIIIGEATDIQYKNRQYKIKYNNTLVYANNIVLATQIEWSKHFADVKRINKPIDTNMLHIMGRPRDTIQRKKYHLFQPKNNIQSIADLMDGTYLLYYKKQHPNLSKFFISSKILSYKHWNPAGTINGHNLIEANIGKNMYLIGDYNIAGLEEAYITGIYSANQIIQKQ